SVDPAAEVGMAPGTDLGQGLTILWSPSSKLLPWIPGSTRRLRRLMPCDRWEADRAVDARAGQGRHPDTRTGLRALDGPARPSAAGLGRSTPTGVLHRVSGEPAGPGGLE